MNEPNLDDNLDSTDFDSTKANSADEAKVDVAKVSDVSTIKPRQNSRTSDIYERFLNRVKHIEDRGETEDVSDPDHSRSIKAKKQSKKQPSADIDELSTSADAGLNPDFDWNFDFEDDNDDPANDHNTHNAEDERDNTTDMQLADATATSTISFDDELPADNQHVQGVQTDEVDTAPVESNPDVVAEPVVSVPTEPNEQASNKKRLMIGGVISALLGVVIVLTLTSTGIFFNSSSDTSNNTTGNDAKDTAVNKTAVNKNAGTALTDTKSPVSEVSNAPAMRAETSAIMDANTDTNSDANTNPNNVDSVNNINPNSAEQATNDASILSYDDFAQEAKSTLYRDIDEWSWSFLAHLTDGWLNWGHALIFFV